jgi:hypothetical protein
MNDDHMADLATTVCTECEPVWEPIEALLPDELTECFMSMYQSTTEEGLIIHAYKHIDTRRYQLIDQHGGTWRYTGGRGHTYCRIPLGSALEEAFCGWGDLMGYTPALGELVAQQIAVARGAP